MTSLLSRKDIGAKACNLFLEPRLRGREESLREGEERELVWDWINRGRTGRAVYYFECTEKPNDTSSNATTLHPLVFEKRLAIDLDAWTSVWAIWIRSWYGDDIEGAAGAGVTQAQSDEAYARLKQKAFCSLEIEGKIDEEVAASCIFDDDWFEWGLTLMDASDSDMEVMDDVPSIVYSALMRCPDALDRIGEETQRHWYAASDAERDLDQALVVLVADGIACEEERVLMASLNHKGQVLCTPQRCGVNNLGLSMTSWRHRRGSVYVSSVHRDGADRGNT